MADPQSQNGQAGVQNTDWQAEKARLESQLSGLANERNAYRQKAQAWEGVGRELGDAVEYDANGLPKSVNYAQPKQTYNGVHPLANAGIDPQAAQQYDAYLQNQMSGQFVTPQQLQAQVNEARQSAYLAATTRFETLRNVDKTVTDSRFKDLATLDSPLSKKTEEVLARNGWGSKQNINAKSWEEYAFAAPNALPIAAQIAKAELFESTQQQANANAQAQQAQAAAGIVSSGGGMAGSPAPSSDEMVRLYASDPGKAEQIAREQFEQKTGATVRH